jgi:phage baseplate assembly protein W
MGTVGSNQQTKWSGLAMPLKKKALGYFTPSTDIDLLKSSINMILGTRIGERVMNPAFGSRLYEIPLTQQVDAVTQILVQEHVIDAINRWEPRVSTEAVDMVRDANNHEIRVKCVFRIVDNPLKQFTLDFALQES